MRPRSVSVLIVDDHPMVRDGIATMLAEQPGLDIVGFAVNGLEAIRMVEELGPRLVLMDIRMPEMDGLTALKVIKNRHPETSIIMLTTYANPQYLARSVSAGATGYLLKSVSRQELLKAIWAAADGRTLIDKTTLRSISRDMAQTDPPMNDLDANLSVRETDVLRLVAEGLNNQEIGEALEISAATVKSHLGRVFDKLQVTDRTQAAVWAARHGLVG